jgi:hypothetical protein
MNPGLLQLIALLLGEAEKIVPIFIHNPKSQQIEGVVVTTANAAVGALMSLPTPAPAPAPAPGPTPTNIGVVTK